MNDKIIRKKFCIRPKYVSLCFGSLVILSSGVIAFLIKKYSLFIEEILMMEKVYIDILNVAIICLLFSKGIFLIGKGAEIKGKILGNPIELTSGIDNYNDLQSRINEYAKDNYEKNSLHIKDTGYDEYFTMYTNKSKTINTIGIYYSNMYFAEIGCNGKGKKKEIRLSNDKTINAKALLGESRDGLMK